jgi:hypothetical protein
VLALRFIGFPPALMSALRAAGLRPDTAGARALLRCQFYHYCATDRASIAFSYNLRTSVPNWSPVDPTGCFTVFDTDLAPGPGTRLAILPQ